jgi:hypothetical protein
MTPPTVKLVLAPSAPTRAELKAEHERKTKDLFECLGAKRAKA